MLTSDLLITKATKGKIEPVYALLDEDNLEISRSVIAVFEDHVNAGLKLSSYGGIKLSIYR